MHLHSRCSVFLSENGNSTCGHEKELSKLKEQVRHLEEINGKMSTDLEQMHAADREKGRLLAELREQLKLLEEDHTKVGIYMCVCACACVCVRACVTLWLLFCFEHLF